jgi:CheY-like chemotaxis protein
MEMIGQIAGGIAHDFNNLLGGILGHASLMLTKLGPEHPAYGSLQTVLQTSRRAATLTDKLLQFARGGPVETAEVDVNGLVEESLGLIARPALAPITIARRLSPASPRFRGDAGQIHQVVMNLILNAADAMPEGGEMRIETGVLNFSDQDVIKHPEAAPGPYVYVEVADSGTGMPPEILHRIFDPFFTTKPPGKGTGLGLAMTYRIVQNHGGFITVESEPGEGSLFRVCFPQHGEERATAAVVAETSPAERTILFVDAQPEVRGAARSVLEVCGYRVLEAAGGAEAFEVFRKHAPRVDLVVLDIAGPEPDGETFSGLRALDPDVRVVLTAQAPLSEAAQGLLRDGAFGVLQKPYGMDAVLKVLHEAAQPSAAHA